MALIEIFLRLRFNVHVPQVSSDYFIEIFASLVEPDANPFGQSFKLKCVCKYKLVCEELVQRMHALPACASGEWGPMKAQRHFGIMPISHKSAIIELSSAAPPPLELRFELPKLLKIHGKLHSNNQLELDKNVRSEILVVPAVQAGAPPQHVLVMQVSLTEEGQYGLDIYARDPDMQTEKRTMSHCCKYLINFSRKSGATAVSPSSVACEHLFCYFSFCCYENVNLVIQNYFIGVTFIDEIELWNLGLSMIFFRMHIHA